MENITILGTGLLGSGVAQNLLDKGVPVVVWNRTREKAEVLEARGAIAARDIHDAVRGSARVHLVLTADDAVDDVLAEALPHIAPGTPVIDHSTNLPARVRERFERLRSQGIRYLHAPVFMSPANAASGTGLIVVSGPASEVEAITPALTMMTGRVWNAGERPDAASIHKLSGNAVLIALAGVMGDLLAMGESEGMSPDEVISLFEVFKPAGNLSLIGPRVARRGTGPTSFELTTARKDVRLMLEAAGGGNGLVVLPGIAAAMDAAIAEGHAGKDYAVFAWPRGRAKGTT